MIEAIAAKSRHRHDNVSPATRRFLRRCAIDAFAFGLGALPVTGLAAPAIRAPPAGCGAPT
jgi:hypothetical protein